jgi:CBS domain-containing protein
MKVSEVLREKGHDVETVVATMSVADLIRRFADKRVRSFVVTRDGSVVGIVSQKDVLRRIHEKGARALADRVSDAMSGEVITVTPDTNVEEIERIFLERRINHIPVVEDHELVGIVTPADVLDSHLRDVRDLNDRLLHYVYTGG